MSASSLVPAQSTTAETMSCALIITRRAHAELLLIKKELDGFALPQVTVPRWERVAPHLVSQVKACLSVEAICLFSGESDRSKDGTSRFCVLEVSEPDSPPENGIAWVSIDDDGRKSLTSEADRAALRSAIPSAQGYNSGARNGQFARSGWFGELTSWIEVQLLQHQLKLGKCWTQYNMGPEFCLLRLETNGPALWFKAVGEPNLREYAITITLARLQSPHVPEIIAAHSVWHGWLMREARGCHLDETSDPQHWKRVACSLAELQVASISISDDLLAAGCKDLRPVQLANSIGPLLDIIRELMAAQTANPPRALTASELRQLDAHLRAACESLQSVGIPDALGQTDFNPGNVLVNNDGASFLDWAEASIGNPFFTLEYLVALCQRLRPNGEAWASSIRDAYLVPWRAGYSDEQLRRALRWTPVVAMLAFSVGCPGWEAGSGRIHPNVQKLLRSVARRMYAESQRPA